MKLGWGLNKRRDALWVQVIQNKYNCGDDLIPKIDKRRTGSNTWNGIKASWDALEANPVRNAQGSDVSWKETKEEAHLPSSQLMVA